MGFEYDKDKSAANERKHGIDFVKVQSLWDDPDRLEIPTKGVDELRHLVIGMIGGRHWSAVVTHRKDNIRLISVRRSCKEEIELYESFGL
jgi:uncharacterized protein